MRRATRRSSSSAALLVAALGLAGCAKPERVEAPERASPHAGEAWFDFRAKSLGVTVEQAKARDEAIPQTKPPEGVLDGVTAVEAALLYRDVCASCHGRQGVPPEPLPYTDWPPPREWGTFGTRMGFFFGGDKMRAGLYRRIRDGGDAREGRPSPMSGWGRALSREQMWALVRHLESL